jgi:hypothetical protein
MAARFSLAICAIVAIVLGTDGEGSGWLERVAIPHALRGTLRRLDRVQCATWVL